jgi:hypothetical protein
MAAEQGGRIISLLKNAIRLSNYTYRDIERQLGWRVGTITRLMRGGLGLKIEHLLSILGVIRFSPGRFFAAAYPISTVANPVEERLYRMLEQMYGNADGTGGTASSGAGGAGGAGGQRGSAKQEDIDEMVRVSLRKLIGATGADPGGPAADSGPKSNA